MNKRSKIYIAGSNGMVGSSIIRKLSDHGYENVIHTSRTELDLTSQSNVNDYFSEARPEYVFLCAAKVGGIHANEAYPADFIRDNLLIQTNVIDAAYKNGAAKLLFLGSSCIYPRLSTQPIKESELLSGPLEKTNEWYAIAKISGIKMCQAYNKQYNFNAISLMPTNLYGVGDNFHLENSHVIPALIRKFDDAKNENQPEVTVWGTGKAQREFLNVDDLAGAAIFLMEHYNSDEIVNVGVGQDITILDLAMLIKEVTGYNGKIKFDDTKPDGTPRKLLDVSRINSLGWSPQIPLAEGLRTTYQWYLDHASQRRAS